MDSVPHRQKYKTSSTLLCINFDRQATLCKRHTMLVVNKLSYHKNPKNFTLKSKHGTTEWKESTRPLHAIASCHCIILHPPKLHATQAASLRLAPSSSVFCTEFTSLRIKCLMAPTFSALAASRMSRPRIHSKM